jgi:hypothetical protein
MAQADADGETGTEQIASHEIEHLRSLVAGLHEAETAEELDETLVNAGTHIGHLRERLEV